jgi:hypothetical protein
VARPPELGGSSSENDRPLLQKLGVKAGARVSLVAFEDPWFRNLLREVTDDVSTELRPDSDLVFHLVRHVADLFDLPDLRDALRDEGAIWVLREKGPSRVVLETDVIDAGKASGLVDNKIASFSDTLAAMRLVIPLAGRGEARRPVRG